MFEHLKKYKRILVSGPQRSGTRICARMISKDTGYQYIDESTFKIVDLDKFNDIVKYDENIVIHCPGIAHVIEQYSSSDNLIIFMHRNVDDILASQKRIGWGDTEELLKYKKSAGIISDIKYDYWKEQKQKIINWLEIEYETLKTHPLWINKELRVNFGSLQTTSSNEENIIRMLETPVQCKYLATDSTLKNVYCEWLSKKFNTKWTTNKATCNLKCRKFGPYDGRDITIDGENRFISSLPKKIIKPKTFKDVEFLPNMARLLNYKELPLSIIIPVLNDNDEVNLTIKSIRETTPNSVEILVIDDGSDIPVVLDDKDVKLFRFNDRLGAGQARHFGAVNAQSKHLLFIDSHMRFETGWYENAMCRVIGEENTLWCGACLGLDSSMMNVKTPIGVYTGADLVLYKQSNNTIFDGVWKSDVVDSDDYEISCVMGACYFIHRDWYFHIRGLEQTMMWGSEEPILSIKTWLAGGKVRLMKSVRIGHKFRSSASYSTNVSHVYYNKFAYSYMLLPIDMYNTIISKFPNDGNKIAALQLIEQNKSKLDEEKKYYISIFKHNIYWLCNKFGIEIPV